MTPELRHGVVSGAALLRAWGLPPCELTIIQAEHFDLFRTIDP